MMRQRLTNMAALTYDRQFERTSIDSIANHRRLDDWFLKVIGDPDQLIRDCPNFGLTF